MKVYNLKPESELSPRLSKNFRYAAVRKYQADLANKLYSLLTAGTRAVVVEAPTGMGKTAAVFSALATLSEETGLKLLWLARTASEVSKVAAEVGALPVYGRRILCINRKCLDLDQRRFNNACYLLRMSGRCEYFPGINSTLNTFSIEVIKEIGLSLSSCPYEMIARRVPPAKALVATHMQLRFIDLLLRKWVCRKKDVILVLDEGHHVVNRVLELIVDEISLTTLERAAAEARKHGFEDLGKQIEEALKAYLNIEAEEAVVEDLLPRLDELITAGYEIQEELLRGGETPSPHIISLADFKISVNRGELIIVKRGSHVYLAVLGGLDELSRILDGWAATVTVSATYDPVLIEKMTNREVHVLRAGWPFGENMHAYIVTGLTTRYEERPAALPDIEWLIKVVKNMTRKTLIFLPSYEMLNQIKGDDLAETPDLSQEEIDKLTDKFSSSPKACLISVYGGRLSEGVDLPADTVILLGIPFRPPTPRNERLLKTLSKYFGSERKARIHGLILPALFSAVQAAGRAVRGPEQPPALVLMIDDRYRRLAKLLPRWFRQRIEGTVKLSDLPIFLEKNRRKSLMQQA